MASTVTGAAGAIATCPAANVWSTPSWRSSGRCGGWLKTIGATLPARAAANNAIVPARDGASATSCSIRVSAYPRIMFSVTTASGRAAVLSMPLSAMSIVVTTSVSVPRRTKDVRSIARFGRSRNKRAPPVDDSASATASSRWK
jgi:hypothetical protein